jgi:hypothetical protein
MRAAAIPRRKAMSEQKPLEFEHEKWLADHELRKREIALKEREASRSRWSSRQPASWANLNRLLCSLFCLRRTPSSGPSRGTSSSSFWGRTRVERMSATNFPAAPPVRAEGSSLSAAVSRGILAGCAGLPWFVFKNEQFHFAKSNSRICRSPQCRWAPSSPCRQDRPHVADRCRP